LLDRQRQTAREVGEKRDQRYRGRRQGEAGGAGGHKPKRRRQADSNKGELAARAKQKADRRDCGGRLGLGGDAYPSGS